MKLIFALLLCASPAFAQWPYVPVIQSNYGVRGSSPRTCAYNNNVTSGDILISSANWETGTATPTISDTLLTSYTQAVLDTSDTVKLVIFIGTAPSSGANTVTITETSGAFMGVLCSELPPNWTITSDVSAVSTFSGSPSTVTSSTITTTLNTDLLYTHIGGFASGGAFSLDSGSFTNFYGLSINNGNDSGGAAFGVAGTNGNYNVTWDVVGNSQGTVAIVAFKSNSLAVTSPATLPDGALSNAYNYTLQAAGGKGAYTWSITSGALQTGLSLNASTGAITGTPTSGPTNSVTFQVADTNSHTASQAESIKVASSLNSIALVQSKNQVTSSSTIIFASNVTAGNMIIINYGWSSGTLLGTCSDSVGTPFKNRFFRHSFYSATGTAGFDVIAAGIAPSSGADTVLCPVSLIGAAEFSNVGFLASDNTGVTTGITATPATVTSNSLTTLVPNELIVGSCFAFTGGSTMTVQSPFTAMGAATGAMNAGYDIVTTVTGYTMSCAEASNTSGVWLFGLVGLRPSGGSPAPGTGRLRGKIL